MDNKLAGRQIHRLPPCPAYDVEGMESWLSDQAAKGWFLTKDGFFAGVATLEQGTPRPAKYRLEAAQKSTSLWAEDGGDPDPEQIELSERYSWEYLGKRGDFYIYRSFDPTARELNTDPQVQAMALNAVKKRQRGTVFHLAVWAVIYPLLLCRGSILLTMIHIRTWLFLLAAFFVCWLVAEEVLALVSLRRLQKKLKEGGCLQRHKDWHRNAAFYHGRRAVKLGLAIVLLCIGLNAWSDSVLNTNKIPLDDYTGTLPFAVMRDFAAEEPISYCSTMVGLDLGFNTVEEWSDWLAPRCIDYNEQARICLPDGSVLDGGYYVDYYETNSPAIAKLLAQEIYRIDRRNSGFEPTDPPALDAGYDLLYAYTDELHFPTVVIQTENRVVRASFYQTSDSTIPLDRWAGAVANSLTS